MIQIIITQLLDDFWPQVQKFLVTAFSLNKFAFLLYVFIVGQLLKGIFLWTVLNYYQAIYSWWAKFQVVAEWRILINCIKFLLFLASSREYWPFTGDCAGAFINQKSKVKHLLITWYKIVSLKKHSQRIIFVLIVTSKSRLSRTKFDIRIYN